MNSDGRRVELNSGGRHGSWLTLAVLLLDARMTKEAPAAAQAEARCTVQGASQGRC